MMIDRFFETARWFESSAVIITPTHAELHVSACTGNLTVLYTKDGEVSWLAYLWDNEPAKITKLIVEVGIHCYDETKFGERYYENCGALLSDLEPALVEGFSIVNPANYIWLDSNIKSFEDVLRIVVREITEEEAEEALKGALPAKLFDDEKDEKEDDIEAL